MELLASYTVLPIATPGARYKTLRNPLCLQEAGVTITCGNVRVLNRIELNAICIINPSIQITEVQIHVRVHGHCMGLAHSEVSLNGFDIHDEKHHAITLTLN